MQAKATISEGGGRAVPVPGRWKKRQRLQLNVAVRMRPLLPQERGRPLTVHTTPGEKRSLSSLLTLSSPGDSTPRATFSLDKCYATSATQHVLFHNEVEPALSRVLAGADASVLVFDAADASNSFAQDSQHNLDVTLLCVKQLFQAVGSPRCGDQVAISYVEVYKDRVRDLLAVEGSRASDMPIVKQSDGSIKAHRLTKKRLDSLHEFETLYDRRRNVKPSHSHSILTVSVRWEGRDTGDRRQGKLHLINVASSEDKRHMDNNAARLNKGAERSSGLLALEKAIAALSAKPDGGSSSASIARDPLREDKLTHLLQECLGESSHVVLVFDVAPTMAVHHETLETLNLAVKAQVVANEMATEHLTAVSPPASCPAATATAKKRSFASNSSITVPASPPTTLPEPKKRRSEPPITRKGASVDVMKEKLRRWKEAKKKATVRTKSGLEQQSRRSSSESGSSSSAQKSPAATTRATTREAQQTVVKPSAKASHTRVAPPKRPQLPQPLAACQASTASTKSQSARKSPTCGKENQGAAVVAPTTTCQAKSDSPADEKPLLAAKKLIALAIELERKRRVATALSVFKRASHLLPEVNAKLTARLQRLEALCPAAVDLIPTQQMPTAVYMQQVLKRDLLGVLNDGSQEDLVELHAIGAKRAALVVQQRPFQQLEDLRKVPGMSANAIAKLYEHHTTWQ